MRIDLLFWGALALVAGMPMALKPRATHIKQEAARNRRIAEIDAGSEESYFEERRALTAYPPPATERRMRLRGIGIVLSGAALIIAALID